MTGFTFETVIANQFLSSLSKSLQALCHGCMDFNAGIEIQGYIHVDVDKEKTFDYVLNEKLQRTTNESMSFISNSFFAKKDHQTQVPNGPLSTSPELQESLHVSSSLKTSSNLSQTDRSLTPQNGANTEKEQLEKRGYSDRHDISKNNSHRINESVLYSSNEQHNLPLQQEVFHLDSGSETANIKQELMEYSNSEFVHNEGQSETQHFKPYTLKSRKRNAKVYKNDNAKATLSSQSQKETKDQQFIPVGVVSEFRKSSVHQNGHDFSFHEINNQNNRPCESIGVAFSQNLEFIPVDKIDTVNCENRYPQLSHNKRVGEPEVKIKRVGQDINEEDETTNNGKIF